MSGEPTRRETLIKAVQQATGYAKQIKRSIEGCAEEATYGREGEQAPFTKTLDEIVEQVDCLRSEAQLIEGLEHLLQRLSVDPRGDALKALFLLLRQARDRKARNRNA